MGEFFALSPRWQLLIIAAGVAICFALSSIIFWRARKTGSDAVPVGPFFVTATTMFALMFSFLAVELWRLNDRAQLAHNQERTALSRLHETSHFDRFDLSEIASLATTYQERVVDDEWGQSRNREATPEVDAIIHDIRRIVVNAAFDGLASPVASDLISAVNMLENARVERLTIGGNDHGSFKWGGVIVLVVLSHIAIAMVHADRPRAGRRALVLFGTVTLFVFWLLSIYANPYAGGVRIDPDFDGIHMSYGPE